MRKLIVTVGCAVLMLFSGCAVLGPYDAPYEYNPTPIVDVPIFWGNYNRTRPIFWGGYDGYRHYNGGYVNHNHSSYYGHRRH